MDKTSESAQTSEKLSTEKNLGNENLNSCKSPVSIAELTAPVLDDTFESIRNKMNPSKLIKVKRDFNISASNINVYNQPIEIYDRKRLWGKQWNKLWSISKRKSKDPFFKIKPLKGFKDPLKLIKKCQPKITPFSHQTFILYHEDWQYVPPPKPTVGFLSSNRSSSESFIKLVTPLPIAEMKVLGKYSTPSVPKNVKCKRRKRTAVGIPTKVRAISPEPVEDGYRAPPGSKNNYSYKKVSAMTDADRALTEVCSLINLSALRKPANKKQVVATLVTDRLPDEILQCLEPLESEPLENMDKGPKISSQTSFMELDMKTGDGPSSDLKSGDEAMEKNDINGLHEISNNPSVQIENSGDSCSETVSTLNKDDENTGLESSFTVDLLELNSQKPHIVRRRVKESTSIAKWIDENILNEFNKMQTFAETSLKTLSLQSFYEPPSKSLPRQGNNVKSLLATGGSLSGKDLSPFKKNISSKGQSDETLPTEVNSVEAFLKEQEKDPTVFHVYKALCIKKFANYGIDDIPIHSSKTEISSASTSKEKLDFESQSDIESIHKNGNSDEYMDNWWNQTGKYVIFTQNFDDEGYLASEEDELPDQRNEYEEWKRLYKSDNEEEKDTRLDKLETNTTSDSNISNNSWNDSDLEFDCLSEQANFDEDEHRSSLESLNSILLQDNSSNDSVHESLLSLSMDGLSCSYLENNQSGHSWRTKSRSLPCSNTKGLSLLSGNSRDEIFYPNRTTNLVISHIRYEANSLESIYEVEDGDADVKMEIGRNNDKVNVRRNSKGGKIVNYLSRVCSKCTLWLKSKSKNGQPR